MTPEQRLNRAEYILVRLAMNGRQARSEFRYKINSLIHAQMRNEAAWRAESHDLTEKINILIRTQMDTDEQIKKTGEQIKETGEQIKETGEQIKETGEQIKETGEQIKETGEQIKGTNEQIKGTNEQIKALAASQAELAKSQKLTDQALRAFINSLRKRGNGNSLT